MPHARCQCNHCTKEHNSHRVSLLKSATNSSRIRANQSLPNQGDHRTPDHRCINMDIETSYQNQNNDGPFKNPDVPDDLSLHDTGPSNNDVLGIAFYSFLGFTIVQSSYAFRAKSSAMVADSSAMFVDSGTYLCNMLAERLKSRPISDEEAQLPAPVLHHKLKLQRLYLELFPPFVSVCTLLYVTCTTFRGAIVTLFDLDDGDGEDAPNLRVMMFFSFLNLLLDAVNVTCFARVHQAVMTPINFDTRTEESPLLNDFTSATIETSLDDDDISEGEMINLNMCSAWTVRYIERYESGV